MKRSVAIVGATGFIGSYLTRHFSNQFDFEVHEFNTQKPILVNGQIMSFGSNFDVIIWAASLAGSVNYSIDSANEELSTWRSFLAAYRNSPNFDKTHLIFLSSGGCVYDEEKPIFSESDSSNGFNLYGQLKSAMERELSETNFKYCILRLANVYGIDSNLGLGNGVISNWAKAILSDSSLNIFGSLDQARDFIHIEDVIRSIDICVSREVTGVFNIGSGVATTLRELIQLLEKSIGKKMQFSLVTKRNPDRHSYALNCEKSLNEFGWKVERDLDCSILEFARIHGLQ